MPATAIERAEAAFARLGEADHIAMAEARRRGDLFDYPLRRVIVCWLIYAWATRNPDTAGDVAEYRASLRAAVRAYRTARPVTVLRRAA